MRLVSTVLKRLLLLNTEALRTEFGYLKMDLSQTKVMAVTSTGHLEVGSTVTVVSSTSVVLNSRFIHQSYTHIGPISAMRSAFLW
ncbi:hypothetical protein BACI348_30217 [Bacillus altitudinis]|uniref:Uncharacterized protein n=1 Tax=Bacillus altitudinis TaxID=293387 RepID=A0A653MXY1_BACAB|nr:hypothetical protein BACI9J_120214 [Bacillus altitudinis]VXB09175.1 hypothetical protein BACI348_30217 [Bacillus altitudinis]